MPKLNTSDKTVIIHTADTKFHQNPLYGLGDETICFSTSDSSSLC
jgi:hypothetical protein